MPLSESMIATIKKLKNKRYGKFEAVTRIYGEEWSLSGSRYVAYMGGLQETFHKKDHIKSRLSFA